MRGQSKVLSAGALEGYSRRLEGDQNKHPSLGEALTNRSEFAEFLIPDTRFTPIPVQQYMLYLNVKLSECIWYFISKATGLVIILNYGT